MGSKFGLNGSRHKKADMARHRRFKVLLEHYYPEGRVLREYVAFRSASCSQMVAKLTGKLSSQRRNRILLEVRETNLPAQLFFKGAGFLATVVLRDYYEDTTEDAYLMQFRYRPQVSEQYAPVNRISRLAG